jgi:ABC-type Zn2+ transport system substrate-binding protein/surface adhesin
VPEYEEEEEEEEDLYHNHDHDHDHDDDDDDDDYHEPLYERMSTPMKKKIYQEESKYSPNSRTADKTPVRGYRTPAPKYDVEEDMIY